MCILSMADNYISQLIDKKNIFCDLSFVLKDINQNNELVCGLIYSFLSFLKNTRYGSFKLLCHHY